MTKTKKAAVAPVRPRPRKARCVRLSDPRWSAAHLTASVHGMTKCELIGRLLDLTREANHAANGRDPVDYLAEALAMRSAMSADVSTIVEVHSQRMSLPERARLCPADTMVEMAISHAAMRGDRRAAAEKIGATPQQWAQALRCLPKGFRAALAGLVTL